MTPVRRVVVAGNGSEAWLAACALQRAFRHRQLEVMVVGREPPMVGPVHWTLPSQRGVHAQLGISETEFLRDTGATFRLASEHRHWQGDGTLFLHAFGDIGVELPGAPFYKYLVNEAMSGCRVAPEGFSLAATAALAGRFARPTRDERALTSSFTYGFHVEERAYAAFLASHAAKLGVRSLNTELEGVETGASGEVAALVLANGERVVADLYIDCTGSDAKIIGRVGQERIDWGTSLPCDRLLTARTPAYDDAPAMTQTIATPQGWMWRAPLATHTACGYVYASAILSDDAATRALLDAAGAVEDISVVSIRSGRQRSFWSHNCVALGKAAFELEPLADSGLQAAALGIGALIELFPAAGISAVEADEYNRVMVEYSDGLRDFTLAQYHLAAKRGGDLWTRVSQAPLPDRLAHKLELYFASGRIHLLDFESFEETDWAWLLLAGAPPRSLELQIQERARQVRPDQAGALRMQIERLASTMPRHMDFLRAATKRAS
jgi:tryptophan halogenase